MATIEELQATYDRRVAHQRRLLAYYDECPDGDPRKVRAEAELAALRASIADVERILIEAVDAAALEARCAECGDPAQIRLTTTGPALCGRCARVTDWASE